MAMTERETRSADLALRYGLMLAERSLALRNLVAAAKSYHGCGEGETNPLKDAIDEAEKVLGEE